MEVYAAIVTDDAQDGGTEMVAFSSEEKLLAYLKKLARQRIEEEEIDLEEGEDDDFTEEDDAGELSGWISENTALTVEIFEATVDEEDL